MTRLRSAWVAVALLVAFVSRVAGAAPLRAAAQGPPRAARDPSGLENRFHLKPGAGGAHCLSCHETFQDTLKLPFVHTPVKAGSCTDCHSPHAALHGKLLDQDASRICQKCHAGIVPEDGKNVHAAILKGGCVSCHDPHGSKNKSNLRLAGNEVCAGCHQELVKASAEARFKHDPVEKSCVTCHNPHSSMSAFLLKKDQSGLCTDCHKADQPAFAKQHMNYPVAKGRCTSCHDPHGSNNKGILWASVHPPVASKMCSQCHEEPSSANALKTKRAGLELCRGCHSNTVNAAMTKLRPHWPVLDQRACLNCHNPHASKQKTLLSHPMTALCGGCHADSVARQARSLTKHPPISEGDCSACHEPHGSDNGLLMKVAGTIELCATCHDWQKHSTHPIGPKVLDKRNKNLAVDCSSCHRSHGSEFKYFTVYDARGDLCVQCHEEFKR